MEKPGLECATRQDSVVSAKVVTGDTGYWALGRSKGHAIITLLAGAKVGNLQGNLGKSDKREEKSSLDHRGKCRRQVRIWQSSDVCMAGQWRRRVLHQQRSLKAPLIRTWKHSRQQTADSSVQGPQTSELYGVSYIPEIDTPHY